MKLTKEFNSLKINYISLLLGIFVAYLIVKLMIAFFPELKSFAFVISGVIFLSSSLFFKISIGLFYRRVKFEDNPFAYWFNVGNYVGFIIFGIII